LVAWLNLQVAPLILYFLSAKYLGAYGIALSNIFAAVLWLILIVVFLERKQKKLFLKLVWYRQ